MNLLETVRAYMPTLDKTTIDNMCDDHKKMLLGDIASKMGNNGAQILSDMYHVDLQLIVDGMNEYKRSLALRSEKLSH